MHASKWFNLATLGLVVTVFSACKPTASQGVRASLTEGDAVTQSESVIPANCGSTVSETGAIYDPKASPVEFETRVKGFLSATVEASEVGLISSAANGTTGVRFTGKIEIDKTGKVVLASSKISISIYDSFVLDIGAQPISVQMNKAADGQFDLTSGEGSVKFKDQYGEILLTGRIDAKYFSGRATYVNYVNVNGSSAMSGDFGQFYVATCGAVFRAP